jgi:hypothetical protein
MTPHGHDLWLTTGAVGLETMELIMGVSSPNRKFRVGSNHRVPADPTDDFRLPNTLSAFGVDAELSVCRTLVTSDDLLTSL